MKTEPLESLILQPYQQAPAALRGGEAFGTALAAAGSAPSARVELAAPVAGANPMLLHGLLVADAARRDRESRQRSRDLLRLLGELQRAMLGSTTGAATLRQLASSLADIPEAADPALAAIASAVALRARIELVRREAEA